MIGFSPVAGCHRTVPIPAVPDSPIGTAALTLERVGKVQHLSCVAMEDELNLPALKEALDEIEFFERKHTDRFYVELAIMLYNSGAFPWG